MNSRFFNIDGPSLSQNDIPRLETLLYDVGSDDKALSPLNAPKKNVIRAGNEENQGNLLFQKFLKTILKYDDLSIGLIIHSANHAVHVFYDKEKKQWTITDNECINNYEDIQEMADVLIKCFSTNGLANLVINTFTDEAPEKTISLFDELDDISNESIKLISQNSTINSADSAGNTALHVAASWRLFDVVKKLLAVDEIDINKKDNRKISPLFIAINSNDIQTVRELFNSGKVDLTELTTTNPFHLKKAAACGFSDIVEELLKQYDKNNIGIPDSGLFCVAIENGHTTVAEKLLKSSKISKLGALHYAIVNKNKKIVHDLLNDSNVDVNSPYIRLGNFTPLHLAAESGDIEIARMLLQRKDIKVNCSDYMRTTTPLTAAIRAGHIALVHELLKHDDIEINNVSAYYRPEDFYEKKPYYYTYLAMAIEENAPNIVKVLRKDPRIDVNKANNKDLTTLCLAVQKKNKDIVHELLKHKDIDVNKGNPLAMAMKQGDFEIAKLLLNHPRINVNQLDADGRSPLYLATTCNDYDLRKECIFAILSNTQVDHVEVKNDEAEFLMNYLQDHFQSFYYMQPLIHFINLLEIDLECTTKINKSIKSEISDIRNKIRENANNCELDDLTLTSIHTQISNLLGTQIKKEISTLNYSSQGLFSCNTGEMMNKFYSDFNVAKNESSTRLDFGFSMPTVRF